MAHTLARPHTATRLSIHHTHTSNHSRACRITSHNPASNTAVCLITLLTLLDRRHEAEVPHQEAEGATSQISHGLRETALRVAISLETKAKSGRRLVPVQDHNIHRQLLIPRMTITLSDHLQI